MFKYSYDSLVYFGEPVEKSIQRLSKYGYDAIELVGEPDNYHPRAVTKLTEDHGIKVSSICSIFTLERDLASPATKVREHAVGYVKQVTDLAAAVGCPTIIIAPTACMKMNRWPDPVEERKWAIDSIRTGAEYAASTGINFAIPAELVRANAQAQGRSAEEASTASNTSTARRDSVWTRDGVRRERNISVSSGRPATRVLV